MGNRPSLTTRPQGVRMLKPSSSHAAYQKARTGSGSSDGVLDTTASSPGPTKQVRGGGLIAGADHDLVDVHVRGPRHRPGDAIRHVLGAERGDALIDLTGA